MIFLYERFSTVFYTIVNEGLSLTIVNEKTNFIKTVVFGKKRSL